MIVFVADYIERFMFYSRMFDELAKRHEIAVITPDPLVYLMALRYKCRCVLIRKRYDQVVANEYYDYIEQDVATSIDVLNADFLPQCARDNYVATLHYTQQLISAHGIEKCILWNGEQLIAKAVARVCERYDVKKLYLEIANLPNKMFVNESGTNARSSLYQDLTELDQLEAVSDADHQQWLKLYEADKANVLPQSKNFRFRKLYSALNYGMKLACRCAYLKRWARIQVRKAKPQSQSLFSKTEFDIYHQPYLFLPLQVSSDTQIKLNSDYDNFAAINYALQEAKKRQLPLLVKIHPAERDMQAIEQIYAQQAKYPELKIVDNNTVELIKHAELVIVINSTVGLEALFYHKKLLVLGRAIYANFDQERLKKYVHRYLVDGINYFSREAIPYTKCCKLLRLNDDETLL